MQRVCLIGLDSATFDLIEPWVAEGYLPNFQRLMEQGAWGRLESAIPPVTAVAWNAFATGKNPGKHGVFDFVQREAGSYNLRVVNGGSRRATPFWKILDQQGLRVGVMNMPMTYPPDRLQYGFIISGFDAPGFESDFVHPSELKEVLRRNGYVIAPLARTREAWSRQLYDSFQVQKRTYLELARTQHWDVLVMVFMQLDQVQHLFWHEMENQIPPFGDTILQFYREANALLGKVLQELDDDTVLIVVSDHGAGPLRKAVSINQWLCKEGYLALKQTSVSQRLRQRALLRMFTALKMYLPPAFKTPLKERFDQIRDKAESYLVTNQIDWAMTRAFSLGEYGGIFINLQGREAEGIVPPENYEPLRSEITERLAGLKDPDTGHPAIRQVYRREEIYNGPYVSKAPDLVLHWDYAYDCRERVGPEHHGVFEDEASYLPFADYKKTGVHRLEGVLLMYGPSVQLGHIEGAHLMDIAPTLLHLLGVPVPDDMDGRVLTEALDPQWLARHPIVRTTPDAPSGGDKEFEYSDEDQALVEKHLRALGYLD